MVDKVIAYINAGLSVIPTHPVHKTPCVESWLIYQKQRPTIEQAQEWFKGKQNSPAIITGAASGNIELLDFDEGARQYQLWEDLVREQAPDLPGRLVQQTTQNGGIHIVYRCLDVQIPGNKKLSSGAIVVPGPGEHIHGNKALRALQYRGKWIISPTLIETRGEGGYFLACPAAGYQLVRGDFTAIPEISATERRILLETAEVISEYHQERTISTPRGDGADGDRPGDIYNKAVTITSLLRDDGWIDTGRKKPLPDGTLAELWRRPGKSTGTSATVYDNKIHVFTSNMTPLEARQTYDPFSYYTATRHFGNWQAAVSDLVARGYCSEAKVSESKQDHFAVSEVSEIEANGKHRVSRGSGEYRKEMLDANVNIPLATSIREYVEENTGIFSVHDLDREFILVTREQKNLRSKILNALAKECKIKKVIGKSGYWKAVDGYVKPMKLGAKVTEPLELTLPLGLSELAAIMPSNIILVAGAPNGGKTAFLLTALYTLLKDKKIKDKRMATKAAKKDGDAAPFCDGDSISKLLAAGCRYLNSEMDEEELTSRVAAFPNGLEVFADGCEFVQRFRDFADVIIPDGINFVDFLEIHEDFFELGKLINEIHENLRGGIVFIAVQKKQGADYAKGGSASLEKPRLVINLDANEGICKTAKIVKCKRPAKLGDSHDGKVCDFGITEDMKFVRYSPWRYVNEKQRIQINRDYEENGLTPLPEKEYEFVFRLKDGKQGRVLKHQVDTWQANYPAISVRQELARIEADSMRKPFLDKGWMFAIPNQLAKVKLER